MQQQNGLVDIFVYHRLRTGKNKYASLAEDTVTDEAYVLTAYKMGDTYRIPTKREENVAFCAKVNTWIQKVRARVGKGQKPIAFQSDWYIEEDMLPLTVINQNRYYMSPENTRMYLQIQSCNPTILTGKTADEIMAEPRYVEQVIFSLMPMSNLQEKEYLFQKNIDETCRIYAISGRTPVNPKNNGKSA